MLLTRFQVKFEPKSSGPNPVLVPSLFFPIGRSHQIDFDHSQGFLVHPNSLPRVSILLRNIPTQARCMNSDAFEISSYNTCSYLSSMDKPKSRKP